MTAARTPWHGVLVATALPMTADLDVDLDRYAEHVAWLAAEGCDGVTPNGSLGEYQTLTAAERSQVVRTAVAAAPDGFTVMPGVAAYGSREAASWAADAAEAGCRACRPLLPGEARLGAGGRETRDEDGGGEGGRQPEAESNARE